MKTRLFVVTGNFTVVNYSYDSPYVYYAINTQFLLMDSRKILHSGAKLIRVSASIQNHTNQNTLVCLVVAHYIAKGLCTSEHHT